MVLVMFDFGAEEALNNQKLFYFLSFHDRRSYLLHYLACFQPPPQERFRDYRDSRDRAGPLMGSRYRSDSMDRTRDAERWARGVGSRSDGEKDYNTRPNPPRPTPSAIMSRKRTDSVDSGPNDGLVEGIPETDLSRNESGKRVLYDPKTGKYSDKLAMDASKKMSAQKESKNDRGEKERAMTSNVDAANWNRATAPTGVLVRRTYIPCA